MNTWRSRTAQVVDEEGGDEQQREAEPEHGAEQPHACRVETIHTGPHRAPLPQEQRDRQRRREHVGAALDRGGTMRVHQRLKPCAP